MSTDDDTGTVQPDRDALERMRAARWVVAMRRAHAAGTPQARRALHYVDGGYCCLGLLCELAVADGVLERSRRIDNGNRVIYREPGSDDWGSTILPDSARLFGEVNPVALTVQIRQRDDETGWTAAELNDTFGLTFAQIADVVTWSHQLTIDELAAAEAMPWVERIEGPRPDGHA
jgi:hypothetical protein